MAAVCTTLLDLDHPLFQYRHQPLVGDDLADRVLQLLPADVRRQVPRSRTAGPHDRAKIRVELDVQVLGLQEVVEVLEDLGSRFPVLLVLAGIGQPPLEHLLDCPGVIATAQQLGNRPRLAALPALVAHVPAGPLEKLTSAFTPR